MSDKNLRGFRSIGCMKMYLKGKHSKKYTEREAF